MSKSKTISIDELEKILNSETEENITILPNGTVKKLRGKKKKFKVLTMRENLGGEYADRRK